MTEFAQVSLGFAEFVGQLLHETFEAVLGAQAHPLEQAAELRANLGLPSEQFWARFVGPQAQAATDQELFGAALVEKMAKTPVLEGLIHEILPESEWKSAWYRSGLSAAGYKALRIYAIEMAVAEHKAELETALARLTYARLIVDSGEVKAKLALSNLYSSEQSSEQSSELPIFEKALTEDPRDEKAPVEPDAKASVEPRRSEPVFSLAESTLTLDGQVIRELTDPSTAGKTIVVDKQSLLRRAKPLPNFRLIASPANSSSNASLLSEVTLRFKIV